MNLWIWANRGGWLNIKLRIFALIDKRLRIFSKQYHNQNQKVYIIQCEDFKDCINIKNKTYYICLGEVTNATNAQDGQKMYLYSNGKDFYVREQEEFNGKFELS